MNLLNEVTNVHYNSFCYNFMFMKKEQILMHYKSHVLLLRADPSCFQGKYDEIILSSIMIININAADL